MTKDENIYVFGHQKPDTDSTCSAIAYAFLKNQIDKDNVYLPVVLGSINQETEFILNYFGIPRPEEINKLKPQVSDINLSKVDYVCENDSIRKTLDIIINQTGRSIPVVDSSKRLIGIVSISDIIPVYLETSGSDILVKTKTPFKNIMKRLNLTIMYGDIKSEIVNGHIYLYNEIESQHVFKDDDIIICDVKEAMSGILERIEVGYIIIGNVISDIHIDNILNKSYSILTTPYNLSDIIKMISQSIPIRSMVKKDHLEYFTTYETVDDVKENMLTSGHKRFPVVDESGYIQGMISRGNLVEINHKRVILVDHNERGQSIEGIEDVSILEVIDHHRVADVQTISPLYFRVEPLGCTCTIIGKMFEENNLPIPRDIAGIMLSAIISDTLLFKSPTCTDIDKNMAYQLEKIAGIDIEKYGIKMITAGATLDDEKPETIISKDMKKFMFGKYKVMISQINTADFIGFYTLQETIKKVMKSKCLEEGYDLAVLMVTDIIIGGTEIIVVGKEKWIAENAFNMRKEDESIFLNGVFSRKKQVVPELMEAAKL